MAADVHLIHYIKKWTWANDNDIRFSDNENSIGAFMEMSMQKVFSDKISIDWETQRNGLSIDDNR